MYTGGSEGREWKNHKYTTRHRNKDGKWVYDTVPMEEEKGLSKAASAVSDNYQTKGLLKAASSSQKGIKGIIFGGAGYIKKYMANNNPTMSSLTTGIILRGVKK